MRVLNFAVKRMTVFLGYIFSRIHHWNEAKSSKLRKNDRIFQNNIFAGTNFRELCQKPRKPRKLIPAKINANKVDVNHDRGQYADSSYLKFSDRHIFAIDNIKFDSVSHKTHRCQNLVDKKSHRRDKFIDSLNVNVTILSETLFSYEQRIIKNL